MINIKLSAILGCAGLVLSLAVGLLSGASFPLIFIRAGIFGVVFFAFGCGLWIVINNFAPELLFTESAADKAAGPDGMTGSRVNITLDDNKVLPEMYRNLDHNGEVGNIGDLVSGAFKPEETSVTPPANDERQGLDQNGEAGYTGSESEDGLLASGGLGGLPDLDSMSGSFLTEVGDDSPEPAQKPSPAWTPSGNKPQKMDGDFNPKELAAGIRTVLSKDE